MMLDPATRSATVRDTRTSPPCARAATRAPVWTAILATSSPLSSTSPVCSPARISSPMTADSVLIGTRHRMPRLTVEGGEETAARGVDFAPTEASELRAARSDGGPSRSSFHRRSPLAARLSGTTDVLNMSVAKTRSVSTTCLVPVRNSSISSSALSAPALNSERSAPGSSTYLACGMCSARYRPRPSAPSLSARWSTRVGTRNRREYVTYVDAHGGPQR